MPLFWTALMAPGSEQARGSYYRHPADKSSVACLTPSSAHHVTDADRPPRLATGHAGDHALVYSLLRALNQAPAHEDFISWLDEPSYEPGDRLLVKHGEQIVAHAQLLNRSASFCGVRIPVAGLQDIAVLPEYARAGYERLIVYAAEQAMRDSRVVVSLVRTENSGPLLSCGWSEVRAAGYSCASVGDVLAHLLAQHEKNGHANHLPRSLTTKGTSAAPRRHEMYIRLWRHVELQEVRSVYDSLLDERWGALCRTDYYWRWLAGRKAHSELIVATAGNESENGSQTEGNIVGYAVTHGSQVLELCCLPGYVSAGPRLLARACQDAIERDYHTISLHTPASDPLHELMVTAGGTWCCEHGTSGGLFVKLLDPCQWVESIFPLLRERAKSANIPRPYELCIDTGAKTWRLTISRRGSRLSEDESAVPELRCDAATFVELLVDNLDAAEIHARIGAVSGESRRLDELAALFPPALFWQSPFDSLRY